MSFVFKAINKVNKEVKEVVSILTLDETFDKKKTKEEIITFKTYGSCMNLLQYYQNYQKKDVSLQQFVNINQLLSDNNDDKKDDNNDDKKDDKKNDINDDVSNYVNDIDDDISNYVNDDISNYITGLLINNAYGSTNWCYLITCVYFFFVFSRYYFKSDVLKYVDKNKVVYQLLGVFKQLIAKFENNEEREKEGIVLHDLITVLQNSTTKYNIFCDKKHEDFFEGFMIFKECISNELQQIDSFVFFFYIFIFVKIYIHTPMYIYIYVS